MKNRKTPVMKAGKKVVTQVGKTVDRKTMVVIKKTGWTESSSEDKNGQTLARKATLDRLQQ